MKNFKKIIATLACALLIWIAFFYFAHGYVILSFPTSYNTPEKVNLPQFQEVKVKTDDGLDLIAWYAPGKPGKPAVIFCHGNQANVSTYAFANKKYIDEGYPIYYVEYRGFGINPGKWSEKGFQKDVIAGWNFLKEKGHDKIILHGFSLGCAIAVDAATVLKPDALILEAPFLSMKHMFQIRPYVLLGSTLLKYPMRSDKKIDKVESPTLIIHGTDDMLIPFNNGEKLFGISSAKDKTFVPVDGAGHMLFNYNSIDIILKWVNDKYKKGEI